MRWGSLLCADFWEREDTCLCASARQLSAETKENIAAAGEKPLIAWAIDAAKNIPEVCDSLVFTDDPEIAAGARTACALA